MSGQPPKIGNQTEAETAALAQVIYRLAQQAVSEVVGQAIVGGRANLNQSRGVTQPSQQGFIDHDHSAATRQGQQLAQANTHESPDTDSGTGSLHHTIGASATQAAAGNHAHAAYLTNPMTTASDLIVGDTGGVPIRLAKGADNEVLTVDPVTHLLKWMASAGGGGGSALTVREADSSPTDAAVTEIVYPNGMIASIVSHVVTLNLRPLNPMSAAGDIIQGGAAGVETRLPIGAAGQYGQVNAGATALAYTYPLQTVTIQIGNGVDVIAVGDKIDIECPYAGYIEQWTILARQTGSIVLDIWRDTYANYPPTVADTITASAKPTIVTATKAQDATLTGWTRTFAQGDIIRLNVDSVTTFNYVTLVLRVRRTA